jgi:hypothetical protein
VFGWQIKGPELVSFSEILYMDGKPMMKELEKVLLPGMFVVGLQVRVWASPCLLSAYLSAS